MPFINKRIEFIANKFRNTMENKKVNKKDCSEKHELEKNGIFIFKENKNINNKKINNKKKLNHKEKPISDSKIKINFKYKKQSYDKIEKKENIKNYIDEEITISV